MKGYELAAANGGKDHRSRDTRVVATFAKPFDLSRHRGLGLLVRGDGKGELLTVELTNRFARREYCAVRQYYVPITFTGERYFEFPSGEVSFWRYYDYEWGQGWDKGFGLADWNQTLKGFDYMKVCRIAIGLNAIPPGQQVSCVVGGIKALKGLGTALHNPGFELAGRKMVFEGEVPPNSYLIYEGGDAAEVRDMDYRPLREVRATGDRLDVNPGESVIRVAYAGAAGPAPWSRLEFKCYGPAEEVAAK